MSPPQEKPEGKDVPPTPVDPPEVKPKDVPPGEAAKAAGETGRKRGRPRKQDMADLKEIEEKLSMMLGAPALAMTMSGDTWPAEHVETRAPQLAHQIALTAKDNAAFRNRLLALLRAGDGAQLAFAVAAYLVPVLIYYGFIPVPPMVKIQLGVPDRAVVNYQPPPEGYGPGDGPLGSEDDETGPPEWQPPGTPGAAPAPGPASPAE